METSSRPGVKTQPGSRMFQRKPRLNQSFKPTNYKTREDAKTDTATKFNLSIRRKNRTQLVYLPTTTDWDFKSAGIFLLLK